MKVASGRGVQTAQSQPTLLGLAGYDGWRLATAADVGIEINVKTSDNIGGAEAALRRLRAAKRAGATTMLLSHRTVRITRAQARYVDYVRGDWRAG
jgi:hypothetical protein